MTEKQDEKILKQCKSLIKRCKELDKAMSLSKKEAKDLTKAELKELQNLGDKLLRWCKR